MTNIWDRSHGAKELVGRQQKIELEPFEALTGSETGAALLAREQVLKRSGRQMPMVLSRIVNAFALPAAPFRVPFG